MAIFKRTASLLALHWAALITARSALITAAFVFVLFVTATAFVIGLRNLNSVVSAAWLSQLLAVYALYFIVISNDEDRRDAFRALGCSRLYDLTQSLVMLAALTPVSLFWLGISLYLGADLSTAVSLFGLMMLFSASSLGALGAARRIVSPHRLPKHLYVLISGPWNLIAMILALSASEALFSHESFSLQILALTFMLVWWGVQMTISRER